MQGSSQAAAEAGALCDAIRHPDQQDSNGPYGRHNSGGDCGGRDIIPACKPPKKEAPWPTLITAGGSLPKDPVTWQTAAVLVDKPLGWTSFDVCGKLRSTLRIKKVGDSKVDTQTCCRLAYCANPGPGMHTAAVAGVSHVTAGKHTVSDAHSAAADRFGVRLQIGHAGTLDPQATGLLIICIGKGCKKVSAACHSTFSHEIAMCSCISHKSMVDCAVGNT